MCACVCVCVCVVCSVENTIHVYYNHEQNHANCYTSLDCFWSLLVEVKECMSTQL